MRHVWGTRLVRNPKTGKKYHFDVFANPNRVYFRVFKETQRSSRKGPDQAECNVKSNKCPCGLQGARGIFEMTCDSGSNEMPGVPNAVFSSGLTRLTIRFSSSLKSFTMIWEVFLLFCHVFSRVLWEMYEKFVFCMRNGCPVNSSIIFVWETQGRFFFCMRNRWQDDPRL